MRLHAAALRSMFKSALDYHLVVESTFARLVKGPVSGDGPARPARRADGSAFTATTYTFLARQVRDAWLACSRRPPGSGPYVRGPNRTGEPRQ